MSTDTPPPAAAPDMAAIMSDINKMKDFFASMPEEFWWKKGEENTLQLFHQVAEQVPAYRNFLREHDINPDDVTTIEDFRKIPAVSKENYFSKYSLPDLVTGGDLASMYFIACSSGTAGQSYYWPRAKRQDVSVPGVVELMYSFFDLHNKSTLFINGVALGTWIAGSLMTYASSEVAKKDNVRMSVITPGAHEDQILNIIKEIGYNYDQIVLLAYTPTARNVIVAGCEQGVDWKRLSPKFIVGGEPVSVPWKRYIMDKIGSTNLMDPLITYGMSEVGILAFETPVAAVLRQLFHQDPSLCESLFGAPALAAFLQFNPMTRWIDSENGELIISSSGGTPVIRYASHDLGGVISYGAVLEQLRERGYDLAPLLAAEGFDIESVWKWPFLYSTGREDAVCLMGANIYPKNIESFCNTKPEVNDFKLEVAYSANEQARLNVHLELREDKQMDENELEKFRQEAAEDILKLFIANNRDFADAYKEEPNAMTPQVIVHEYHQGPFTHVKIKQRHVLI